MLSLIQKADEHFKNKQFTLSQWFYVCALQYDHHNLYCFYKLSCIASKIKNYKGFKYYVQKLDSTIYQSLTQEINDKEDDYNIFDKSYFDQYELKNFKHNLCNWFDFLSELVNLASECTNIVKADKFFLNLNVIKFDVCKCFVEYEANMAGLYEINKISQNFLVEDSMNSDDFTELKRRSSRVKKNYSTKTSIEKKEVDNPFLPPKIFEDKILETFFYKIMCNNVLSNMPEVFNDVLINDQSFGENLVFLKSKSLFFKIKHLKFENYINILLKYFESFYKSKPDKRNTNYPQNFVAFEFKNYFYLSDLMQHKSFVNYCNELKILYQHHSYSKNDIEFLNVILNTLIQIAIFKSIDIMIVPSSIESHYNVIQQKQLIFNWDIEFKINFLKLYNRFDGTNIGSKFYQATKLNRINLLDYQNYNDVLITWKIDSVKLQFNNAELCLQLNLCAMECQLDLYLSSVIQTIGSPLFENNTESFLKSKLPSQDCGDHNTLWENMNFIFIDDSMKFLQCDQLFRIVRFLEDKAFNIDVQSYENSTPTHRKSKSTECYVYFRAITILRIFRLQIILRFLQVINLEMTVQSSTNPGNISGVKATNDIQVEQTRIRDRILALKKDIKDYFYKIEVLIRSPSYIQSSITYAKLYDKPECFRTSNFQTTHDNSICATVKTLIIDMTNLVSIDNSSFNWQIKLHHCNVFDTLSVQTIPLISNWIQVYLQDFELFIKPKQPLDESEQISNDVNHTLKICEIFNQHSLPVTHYQFIKIKNFVAQFTSTTTQDKPAKDPDGDNVDTLLRLYHFLFWLSTSLSSPPDLSGGSLKFLFDSTNSLALFHSPYETWSKDVMNDINEIILNLIDRWSLDESIDTETKINMLNDRYGLDILLHCLTVSYQITHEPEKCASIFLYSTTPNLPSSTSNINNQNKPSLYNTPKTRRSSSSASPSNFLTHPGLRILTSFLIYYYYLKSRQKTITSPHKNELASNSSTAHLYNDKINYHHLIRMIEAPNCINYLPPHLQYLDIVHTVFGKCSLCTINEGKLLKLYISEFYHEAQLVADAISAIRNGSNDMRDIFQKSWNLKHISSPSSRNILLDKLEEYNEELGVKIEQAYYCLYDFTERKWKNNSKYLKDHGPLIKVKFELNDAPMLFNFLKPAELPSFHSKTYTINSEIKDLFEHILKTYHKERCDEGTDSNIKTLQNSEETDLIKYLNTGEIFTIDDEICSNDIEFTINLHHNTINRLLRKYMNFILNGNIDECVHEISVLSVKSSSLPSYPISTTDNSPILFRDNVFILPSNPLLDNKAPTFLSSPKRIKKSLDVVEVVDVKCPVDKSLGTVDSFESVVLAEIYYLMADYYFKNMYTCKSLRFYLMDVCYNELLDERFGHSFENMKQIDRGRFDTWAGIALVRSSSFEQLLRTVNLDFLKFPFNSRYQGTLACFDKAIRLYDTSPPLPLPHSPRSEPIITESKDISHSLEDKQAITSLWVEKGALAYMLAATASRKIKRQFLYHSTEQEITQLCEFRIRMLEISKTCYQSAQDSATGNEEKWLYAYMLGKIFEKLDPDKSDIYLLKYRESLKYLEEQECSCPKKINFHNPQYFSIETCEIFYRIHASILKSLQVMARTPTTQIVLSDKFIVFQRHLKEVWESRFVKSVQYDTTPSESPQECPSEFKNYLIQMCLRGIKLCLIRLPQHYKSFYRLAYHYFVYNKDFIQGINFAKSLFVDQQVMIKIPVQIVKPTNDSETIRDATEHGKFEEIHLKVNSLLGERKKSLGSSYALFGNIWRLPVEECDRPGSFPYHVYQIAKLFLEICLATRDMENLVRLIQQTKKAPEKDKRYIYESERKYLYEKSLNYLKKLNETNLNP